MVAPSFLTSADVGAPARDKINAWLQGILDLQGNLAAEVANRAAADAAEAAARASSNNVEIQNRAAADSAEAAARIAADSTETAARIAADNYEVSNRAAADQALADAIERLRPFLRATRPGDYPAGFTASSAGGPVTALLPLDTTAYHITQTADGLGVRLTGSQEVWSRRYGVCESGSIAIARWRFTRTKAPTDPDGDAIGLFVGWYDAALNAIEYGQASEVANLAVGDHADVTLRLGDSGVPGVDSVRPPGAVYFRLGLKSWGVEGATVLTDMWGSDVTELLSSIRTELAALIASPTSPVVARDGSLPMLGDLNLGGHRVIAAGTAQVGTDLPNFAQVLGITSAIQALVAALQAQVTAINPAYAVSMDPNFEFAVGDALGDVAFGVGHFGVTDVAQMRRPVAAFVDGAPGARDVRIASEAVGEINVSGGEFPDYAIIGVDSSVLAYIGRPGDGTVVERLLKLESDNTFAQYVTEVHGVPIHGQSNTVGTNNYKVLTTTPLNRGRGLMFNIGTKTLGDLQDSTKLNEVLLDSHIASLVDMYEIAQDAASLAYGETTASHLGQGFLGRAPGNVGVICHIHGIGGESIDVLTVGTVPYQNLIKAVRRANFLTRFSGRRYKVLHVSWIQGEADALVSQASYYAKLQTLQSALDQDIRRITGQTETVKLAIDGMSVAPGSGVPLAMMQAAIEHPDRFIMTGPRYQLPYVDALHHTALGDAWLGEYDGRAMAIDTYGGGWLPLFCKSAVRSGTTITTKWNIPKNGVGLTFDNVNVTDPTSGNYGLRFLDNAPGTPESASVTLADTSRPQITASDTIVCTLTGVPTGPNPRIEIAQYSTDAPITPGAGTGVGGPTTSPRACIRDLTAETADVPDGGAGTHTTVNMANWACHGSVPVTGA